MSTLPLPPHRAAELAQAFQARPTLAPPPLGPWLARRPVRAALLLAAVWLLNALDLHFTLTAVRLGPFVELNPVADLLIRTDDLRGLALYKLTLVFCGTSLLWRLRHCRAAEIGCWLAALLYGFILLRWYHYYLVWSDYRS